MHVSFCLIRIIVLGSGVKGQVNVDNTFHHQRTLFFIYNNFQELFIHRKSIIIPCYDPKESVLLFLKKVDEDIDLVFLEESLAKELFNLIDSDRKHLSKWLPWVPLTKSIKDSKKFIKSSIIAFAENRSMVCAIKYQENIVGVIGYNIINHSVKKVDIGYWIGSRYQGRGIITKSCNHLIQYAFNQLAMQKVQIAVATDNTPSRKVCERLGFKLEGIITNSENLHGKIVDHAIYGITG